LPAAFNASLGLASGFAQLRLAVTCAMWPSASPKLMPEERLVASWRKNAMRADAIACQVAHARHRSMSQARHMTARFSAPSPDASRN
jgi:hypothetical protein